MADLRQPPRAEVDPARAERTADPAHDDHVVSPLVYYLVFAALLVLTVVTVAVSRVHLGALNLPVALGIAVAKAVLVILFFMHVKYSPRLIGLVVVAAFFWLFHLLAGTTADYFTRGRVDPAQRAPGAFSLEDR